MKSADRSHWTIRKFSSVAEQRRQQIRDWQRLPAAARANAVWEMVVEYSRQQGIPEHELRLHRSVTSVRRS